MRKACREQVLMTLFSSLLSLLNVKEILIVLYIINLLKSFVNTFLYFLLVFLADFFIMFFLFDIFLTNTVKTARFLHSAFFLSFLPSCKGAFYGASVFDTIPQSAALTAPFAQGSLFGGKRSLHKGAFFRG